MSDLLQKQREYVRSVLKAKGWTGNQLAAKAKLGAASTINRPLKDPYKGLYSLTTLRKIADASGIPVPAEILSPGEQSGINGAVISASKDGGPDTGGSQQMPQEEKELIDLFRKLDTLGRLRVLNAAKSARLDQVDADVPLETRRRG